MNEYPILIPVPVKDKLDECNYRQSGEYYSHFKLDGVDYDLLIEDKFTSDGTSSNKFISFLTGIQRYGLEIVASWPHDKLYSTNGGLLKPIFVYNKGRLVTRVFTKDEADTIFYQILFQAKGVSGGRAEHMYWAVKHFGQAAWDSHQKDNPEQYLNSKLRLIKKQYVRKVQQDSRENIKRDYFRIKRIKYRTGRDTKKSTSKKSVKGSGVGSSSDNAKEVNKRK